MSTFIKRKREEAGLTQAQLAEKMDVTVVSVQNWENGKMPAPKKKESPANKKIVHEKRQRLEQCSSECYLVDGDNHIYDALKGIDFFLIMIRLWFMSRRRGLKIICTRSMETKYT